MKELQTTAHSLNRGGFELRVRVKDVADERGVGHVLIFGELTDGCLVRIHSRCLYGETLGADDCDCGPELALALELIKEAGGQGVLIYLEQEGRGAGLEVKAQGLHIGEETGADTFDAYRMLGHPEDARTYDHAAAALKDLGLRSVRLMTNNPDKVQAVENAGLVVKPIPLETEPRSERAALYMAAKAKRRSAYSQLPAADR